MKIHILFNFFIHKNDIKYILDIQMFNFDKIFQRFNSVKILAVKESTSKTLVYLIQFNIVFIQLIIL